MPSTPDILIQITTDNWPEETGWSITDDQGNEVAGSSVGTLAGNPNTTFTWEVELVPDGCYELTFFDAYGDGMFASQWGDYVDGAIDVYAMNGEGEPVSILWQYDGASGAMFAETSVGIEVSISCDDPERAFFGRMTLRAIPREPTSRSLVHPTGTLGLQEMREQKWTARFLTRHLFPGPNP